MSTMTMRQPAAAQLSPRGQSRSASPATGSGLRLTRRGRVAVVVIGALALAVVVLAAVLAGGGSAAAGEGGAGVPARYHVVAPGETLWLIAGEIDGSGDPRDTIAEIRELNHLASAELPIGLRLVLPAAG